MGLRARRGLEIAVVTLMTIQGPFFNTLASSYGVTVPGFSNPWLAGMPPGSAGAGGDAAPAQSPVLVPGLVLSAASQLMFSVNGTVGIVPTQSGNSPDGGRPIKHPRAVNGIASLTAPRNSLIGVFLDDGRPDSSPAPGGLNFTANGTDFANLSPALKQPFFIGDGRTGTEDGAFQTFTVPPGATRLYLGTMDGHGWYNNSGAFKVTIHQLEATVNRKCKPKTTVDDMGFSDSLGCDGVLAVPKQ